MSDDITSRDEAYQRGVDGPEDLLDPFLGLLDQFIATYADGVRYALGDNDLAGVAETVSRALQHQVRELGRFLREGVPMMTPQGVREMNQVLRMQGGDILLEGATQAASGTLSPEKLMALDDIFHEIKKILQKLLAIIWKNKPAWFDEFFLLLDELFRLLATFLFPRLKTPLHKSEVQYLHELYELRRLELLLYRADAGGDDDDDV